MRLRSRLLWWTALLVMLFVPTSAWKGDANDGTGLRVTVREPLTPQSAARRWRTERALATSRAAFSAERRQLRDDDGTSQSTSPKRNRAKRQRRHHLSPS